MSAQTPPTRRQRLMQACGSQENRHNAAYQADLVERLIRHPHRPHTMYPAGRVPRVYMRGVI